MSLRLSGPQLGQLRDALLAAFAPVEFDAMLLTQLDRRRTDIITDGGQQWIVLQVVAAANRQLWIDDLLRAARMSRPRDPVLFAFAQQFRRAIDAPAAMRDDSALQHTIRAANGTLDPIPWRTRMAELEGRICRIEYVADNEPVHGTGFLLGCDLVMTNYHVIKPVKQGQVAPADVGLRFDYAVLADGVTPNPGTVYRLAQPKWLVDCSPYSLLDEEPDPAAAGPPAGPDRPLDQLDYALLRVAGAPGAAPVGSDTNKDPEAPARGWITPPTGPEQYAFRADSAILILQHPKGQELKLAMDTDAVIGVNGNHTRVRYRTTTEHGSSGSPCFDANWNLVALHHSGDPGYPALRQPTYNQGVPFTTILQLLEERGKRQELGK